jgi:hypothetical protein
MVQRGLWFIALIFACAPWTAHAQPPPNPSASAEEGIPVESELVRSRCGSCHKVDDHMRMSRISYRRASLENWEKTIK